MKDLHGQKIFKSEFKHKKCMHIFLLHILKANYNLLLHGRISTIDPETEVFRIRMDPGFIADPDPYFQTPDPDPSINKPMRCKWCFWLGFGGTWPKRTVLTVERAKYEINTFSTCTYSLTTFFSWIRIRIFPDRIRFSANPDLDLDSGNKVWSGSGKKPISKTLHKRGITERGSSLEPWIVSRKIVHSTNFKTVLKI